jgi:hypothetical protein
MRILSYLDPGSGSMIASAIAAGFAGIVIVFKVGARRVTGTFSRKRRRAAVEGHPADDET